ncbi:MAG: transposase [Balneolales bacterium]
MPRRKTDPAKLYFITLTVHGWIDLFTRHTYADVLITNLKYCMRNKELRIYYYCIMPSHIHLIAAVERGSLNEVIGQFKSYTAKQLLNLIDNQPGESRKDWLLYLFEYFGKISFGSSKYQVWKPHNYPVVLYNDKVIQQKMDYIHLNPIRSGIVNVPEAYVYSSANESNPLAEVIRYYGGY